MFFKNPSLPDTDVSCVIVDRNAPDFLFNYLDENSISYIKSARIENVIDGVSTHPDMQICHIGENLFVCEPSVYGYYSAKLEKYGAKIICGGKKNSLTYPNDISYNVVITNKILVHNTRYTEKAILNYALNKGLGILSVKQGYTKCAVCVVAPNAFITSDVGIHKALVENGANCLLVESGEIALGERKDGFIGGSCGMLGDKKLLFCGDLSAHPRWALINSFAQGQGVKIISVKGKPLTDVGSIIPVF